MAHITQFAGKFPMKEKCNFIFPYTGNQCNHIAKYWVGTRDEDASHVCGLHIEKVFRDGNVIHYYPDGWDVPNSYKLITGNPHSDLPLSETES